MPDKVARVPADADVDRYLQALNGDIELEASDSLRKAIGHQLDLVRLWRRKLTGNGTVPLWADFEIKELQPWLGSLNLVETLNGGEDFHYVVYGTHLGQRFGDMTGKRVSEAEEPRRSLAMSFYRMLVREPWPTLGRQSQWTVSRYYYVFRLGLPLSYNGISHDRTLVHVHVSDQVASTDEATFVRIG